MPSVSADGTVATVFQTIDKRDPDKSQRRYRKKVIKANGLVVKDVDVALSNQGGHGNAGILRDLPPREVPGDPMYVTLAVKQPST